MVNNSKIVKTTMAALTLIGAVGTGIWSIEARYAKAADVKELKEEIREQTDELKLIVLEGRLYDLKFRKERESLTLLEKRRMEELEAELDRIKWRLNSKRERR